MECFSLSTELETTLAMRSMCLFTRALYPNLQVEKQTGPRCLLTLTRSMTTTKTRIFLFRFGNLDQTTHALKLANQSSRQASSREVPNKPTLEKVCLASTALSFPTAPLSWTTLWEGVKSTYTLQSILHNLTEK